MDGTVLIAAKFHWIPPDGSAMEIAEECGLISGLRASLLRDRMPLDLVEQAKLRSGISSDDASRAPRRTSPCRRLRAGGDRAHGFDEKHLRFSVLMRLASCGKVLFYAFWVVSTRVSEALIRKHIEAVDRNFYRNAITRSAP
jgi:hypothetical protein